MQKLFFYYEAQKYLSEAFDQHQKLYNCTPNKTTLHEFYHSNIDLTFAVDQRKLHLKYMISCQPAT